MSGHQYATIEDTVYFWFAANDTSGSGGDGATALFDVREAGAAASAIPLLSGTATLLTHANFPAGCYEVAVAATVANGFAANDTFAVFCTLAIDSQNPTGLIGSCTLTPFAAAVWDAPLSDHTTGGTAGKRLQTIPSTIIREDTAQGAGTGTNQIQFDTGASAVDGAYDPALVTIMGGTGIGQTRLILQYNGTTKTATVDRDWKVNPDATSEFIIIGDAGREHVNEGLAQAGTANTITLNTLASAGNDVYIGQIVSIRAGTGADQTGTVIAYNGTTKVATVHKNWVTNPDSTSSYVMLPASPVELTANAIDLILDEALSGHTTAGTLGKAVSDINSAATEARLAELDAGNLPADIAANTVTLAVIEGQTDDIGIAGAGLTDLGGMSTGMKAEINVQVDLALDTPISELGVAVPTATPTVRTGIMLGYMALRNQFITQTSGTDAIEIHNNAGVLITKKLISDDGADYTEAKMS